AGHAAAERARCDATAADMRSAKRADAHGAAADTHSTEAAAYTPNMTHAADAGPTKAAAAHAGPTKAAATEVAASAASEVAAATAAAAHACIGVNREQRNDEDEHRRDAKPGLERRLVGLGRRWRLCFR